MMPTTLVTIVSVLVKLSCSSPVYNMQPAYITATIGSMGRNIRNLPCISRKSNQSGVCMFAIDCLKANGTHLGTCIDRFYFGSCCHIEPVHDITENTIDTALIPSRQPPNRISSTTEKTVTYSTTESIPVTTTIITTTKPTTTTITTDKTTSATSIQEMLTKLTTIAKVTPTTVTPTTNIKTTITTKVPLDDETTVPYKISTFQSVDGNEITTTIRPFPTTTPTPRPSSTKPVKPITITKPIKPTSPNKTKPPHNVTSVYRPTNKPVTKVTTKPRPRPSPTKPIKITKPTIKPINATRVTSKPVKTTTNTKIPATEFVFISKKPVQATNPPKTTMVTRITSVIVTKIDKPSTVVTQTEPTMTTINLIKVPPTPIADEPTTVKNVSSVTESNELPINLNSSTILESVNGNPATNEIESEKPIKPAPAIDVTTLPTLVTWSQVHDNSTTVSSSSSGSSSAEPEDWVPITTPDGWVLLPSLSTVTEPTSSESSISSSSSQTQSDTTSTSTEAASTETSQSTSTESIDGTSSIETIVSLSTTSSEETSPATLSGSSTLDVNNTTTTDGVTTESSSSSSKPAVNMTDYTDVCGRRMFPEARIVGGDKSSFGKWPWQISLRQWRTSTYLHKCGAALLNENWAITAAHCVDNVPPSDLLLRLGEHDLSTESEPYLHQERRVQIVASHPQFDPRTFEYDLALLRFYEPVSFQPNIIPVCVPQNDENFVGRTAYVTGWGRLYEDGPLPSILQEVSVPVINNTVCESMYRSAGYIEHIPNIFICAGWRRGGFDSCEGDSGGPMVIQRPDKRFLLAGVISWGIGCAEPNQPGVYTRISEFRDWINQILQF